MLLCEMSGVERRYNSRDASVYPARPRPSPRLAVGGGNVMATPKSTPPRPRQTVSQRFWSKVAKTDSCWLWKAGVNKGYGQFAFSIHKHVPWMRQAHRVAWELSNGSIPAGLSVLHRCDVPLCVNPAHLFLGTHTDNMRDMVAKGRGRFNSRSCPTHCLRGHERTPETTRTNRNGSRACRVCEVITRKARRLAVAMATVRQVPVRTP